MFKNVILLGIIFIFINCTMPHEDAGPDSSPKLSEFTTGISARSSDVELHDYFGKSIAAWGNTILVGADGEDGGTGSLIRNAGAAYVFELSDEQLNETAKLTASDANASAYFGMSSALTDSIAVIGAPGMESSNGANDNAGCAYVFEKDSSGNWNQSAILRSSDLQANDKFGMSVAVHDSTIVISANEKDNGPLSNTGAVYIFEKNATGNWIETSVLQMNESTESANFGYSLDINGNTIAVGAPIQEIGGVKAGAVYIFKMNSSGDWQYSNTLAAPNFAEGDRFGYAVSLSEDNNEIAVSALLYDSSPSITDSGTLYLFSDLNSGSPSSLQLSPSEPQHQSDFGKSIKLYNDSILVGSPKYDTLGLTDNGCAYIYEYDSSGLLNERKILTPAGSLNYDNFGCSLFFCDSYAAVGAYYAAQQIYDQNSGGRIHLFY